MSIREAGDWFGELNQHAAPKDQEIACRILKEINERLGFLINVGLEYLTLDRELRHAVGRREPAHPARLADRLAA